MKADLGAERAADHIQQRRACEARHDLEAGLELVADPPAYVVASPQLVHTLLFFMGAGE